MSNGYLVAAEADLAAAREIGDGFELDVLNLSNGANKQSLTATLAAAANVGILLSNAATRDAVFFSLLQTLAQQLPRAQVILVEPDAASHFGFVPAAWPAMPLDEARRRAGELKRRREPAPEPPAPAPLQSSEPVSAESNDRDQPHDEPTAQTADSESSDASESSTAAAAEAGDALATQLEDIEPPSVPIPPLHAKPPEDEAPAPRADAESDSGGHYSGTWNALPADSHSKGAPAFAYSAEASAFAPKKLRRGTPELVRVVVHQPSQLKEVIRAAKKIDPRAEAAPQGMKIGDIPLAATIGVSLDVRGAACDGVVQRRAWRGEPIDFSFSVEADADARQAVIFARVFVADAQVGTIAFTRAISGAAKKPAAFADARMKRVKRVFLSYSSADRETVAAIATAYEAAGVPYFWDRSSLKSGEEWSPRLRKEIDQADLFHLCWSKAASKSEWVEKEAEHALTRRAHSKGKHPDITVQMLDGPPWAPHPAHLDSINFDDFVRAAVVGYARGDGNETT